jgi:hypothetical protein
LLEDVGFDELIENLFAIDGSRRAFETLDDPTAAFHVRNVHELRADGAAIDLASGFRVLTVELQLGMRDAREVAERVEVGLEIAPAAEKFEYAFSCFYVRSGFGRRKGLSLQNVLLRIE